MGGCDKDKLDLLEQKIKFALRPVVNTISTTGMTRERKLELDSLLGEITALQQSLEQSCEHERSTELKVRLAGLVDHLNFVIKGAGLESHLPDRRQHLRTDGAEGPQPEARGVRIVNLNPGGMRLHSSSSLKVGSVVRTELALPGYGVISLKGEVIWVKEDERKGGYVIGVHFLPMAEEVSAALGKYLERRRS